MIKKRWNIKKEKLKEKLLNEQQGFIVGNALIILPNASVKPLNLFMGI